MTGAEEGSKTMTDQDVELSRQEVAQQQEEANLHAELARMLAATGDYDRRIKQLKDALADAEAHGVKDPQVSEHVRRLAVPPLDGEAPFAQARQLRVQALKARQQATAAVRQQLGQFRAALQQLAQTLTTDEQVVQRLVQQAHRPAPAPAPAPARAAAPHDDGGLGATMVSQQVPPALKARASAQAIAPMATQAAAAAPAAVPKRQSPRVRMQARVDLESDDNFFNGFSSNISDGGVFIATVNLLPLGTSVDVGFTLPTGERIECRGVVRWVREVDDRNPQNAPGMGVQFVELEPRAAQAIERFIEQREPMFYVE
jgi:uncharacterized protein (TIGR02266 family)